MMMMSCLLRGEAAVLPVQWRRSTADLTCTKLLRRVSSTNSAVSKYSLIDLELDLDLDLDLSPDLEISSLSVPSSSSDWDVGTRPRSQQIYTVAGETYGRRQSLTISAINHSGRASELWGITNIVDRRRSSLSRLKQSPISN